MVLPDSCLDVGCPENPERWARTVLRKVEIKNFRCLRNVSVALRPLTILIGPNDSGKSAFLRSLVHVARTTSFEPLDYWRADRANPPRITGDAGGIAQFEATPNATLRVIPEGARSLLEPLGFYDLPSSGAPMQSGGHPDEHGPPQLGAGGEQSPALLDFLLRRDRKRFFAFVEAMCRLVPGLEEVEIATPDAGVRRIDLVIEKGLRIPGDVASAGVRLLIFFVALAYHPSPPRLILLEEPENGVHPKRLGDVMRLLREITQGVHGDHAAQVVLTTHSPHLLDYVDIEKDQVLVFRRNDDGSRTAEPADAERLKNFLDEFMLGEVWYNEGEAGLVGRDK